jgi:acyl carrier protein
MSQTYEDVLKHIVDYLRTKLKGASEIDENTDFTRDLNVDSLLIFATVEDLEETYQIVIPLELLYQQKIQTVGELAKEVLRLIGRS